MADRNSTPTRVAIYARVSTLDQSTDSQLLDLRRYVSERGWTSFMEYVDEGISGTKDSRPALNELMNDARKRRFDVVLVWRFVGRDKLVKDVNCSDSPVQSNNRCLFDCALSGRFRQELFCRLSQMIIDQHLKCSQGKSSGIDDSRPERLDLGRTKPSGARPAGCSRR